MQTVPIQPVPNQQFSFSADNNTYSIILKATALIMSASISINGVLVIEGLRAAAWRVIIPSEYQENGNFMFMTQNLQLPWYQKFGVSQSLVYLSQAELQSIRASNLLFSPFGALPLRFSPQGYTLA